MADRGVPRDRQAPQDRLLHPAGALPDLLRRDEPGLRQDPATRLLPGREQVRRPGSAIWTPSTASPAWISPSAGIASPGAASPLGWRARSAAWRSRTSPTRMPMPPAWGPYIRFEHDTLDSRYFPYQGSTGTSRGLLLRRSRPRGRALRAGRGVNYRLVMIKPWSWDRHSLNLMLEGAAQAPRRRYHCSCRIWGAVPHVRLPALPVERSLQPVRRIALHLPGGGQRFRCLQGAPVPRGLPRARGVWDKGEDISIESSHTSGSLYMGWRVSSVPSSSAMAWRRGHDMFYLQLGTTFQ